MANDLIRDVLKSAEFYAGTSRGDVTLAEDGEWIFRDLDALVGRLNQLQNSDLSNNDRMRLFCRQLKRLMDYNNYNLDYKFWLHLNDYLIYVLDEPESRVIGNTSQELFQKSIAFEEELERRQRQFQLKIPKQKNLDEFFAEHKEPIEKYIQECERFHSTLQLTNLIENIDDFLRENYDLENLPLNNDSRQRLEEELKCIQIPLDFFTRKLTDKSELCSTHAQLKKPIDSNTNNFLTSANRELTSEYLAKDIVELLETERWLVILGDPANGKTTLLRSFLHIYATKFYHSYIEKRYYTEPIRSYRIRQSPTAFRRANPSNVTNFTSGRLSNTREHPF
jgi:hypothetical protein